MSRSLSSIAAAQQAAPVLGDKKEAPEELSTKDVKLQNDWLLFVSDQKRVPDLLRTQLEKYDTVHEYNSDLMWNVPLTDLKAKGCRFLFFSLQEEEVRRYLEIELVKPGCPYQLILIHRKEGQFLDDLTQIPNIKILKEKVLKNLSSLTIGDVVDHFNKIKIHAPPGCFGFLKKKKGTK